MMLDNVNLKRERDFYQLELEEQVTNNKLKAAGSSEKDGQATRKVKSTSLLWKKLSKRDEDTNLEKLVDSMDQTSDYLNLSVQQYFPEADMADKKGMRRLMTALSNNVLDIEGDNSKKRRMIEEEEKNPWDRFLVEFSAAELQMMQNLSFIANPEEIFPDSHITFRNVIEQLNSKQLIDDKAVITKIFSLLDERMSGVISAENLTNFIKAVQEYTIGDRIMSDVSAHTSFRAVIRDNNLQGHLSLDGAKMIIADLRGVTEEEVRDSDLGVEYLINSTERQLERLLTNCPEAAWKTLQQFHRFELMIRHIESQLRPKEIDLGFCDFELFHESFTANGIGPDDGITETILKVGLDTVGIDPSSPFSWMLAFNLLADPFTNADEIRNLDVSRTSKESKKLDRVIKQEEWKQKYEADAELAATLVDATDLVNKQTSLENKILEQERALELREQQRAQQENQAQSLIDHLMSQLNGIQSDRKLMQRDMGENEAEKQARDEKENQLTGKIAQIQNLLDSIGEAKAKQRMAMENMKMGESSNVDFEEQEEKFTQQMELLQQELTAQLEDKDRMLKEQVKAQERAQEAAEQNKHLLEQADEAVARALQTQFNLEEKNRNLRASQQRASQQRSSRRRDEYYDERPVNPNIPHSRGAHAPHYAQSHLNRYGGEGAVLAPQESLRLHQRGISTENYTSRGTVRKRVIKNIRRDESVKLRDGRKGIVKWEGRVDDTIGFVLGVDIFLGTGEHDGVHIINDGQKNIRKFFFRCRPGQGSWVKHTDITHVYRKRDSDGKEEKVRYQPDESIVQQSRGAALPVSQDDEAMMNAAMRGLNYAQVKHMGPAERGAQFSNQLPGGPIPQPPQIYNPGGGPITQPAQIYNTGGAPILQQQKRKEIVKTKSGRFGEVVDKAFDETGTHYAIQLQGGELAFRRENSVQEIVE